jgi:hypothetical protein
MAEYMDALSGITQEAPDDCDASFSPERRGIYAYLKVGAMHGVTIGFERRYGADGRIPGLARDGVVMRFVLPIGVGLADLAAGLGEGGSLAGLIERLLGGHLLTLAADHASGRLGADAEAARDRLLEEIAALGSAWHATAGRALALDLAA